MRDPRRQRDELSGDRWPRAPRRAPRSRPPMPLGRSPARESRAPAGPTPFREADRDDSPSRGPPRRERSPDGRRPARERRGWRGRGRVRSRPRQGSLGWLSRHGVRLARSAPVETMRNRREEARSTSARSIGGPFAGSPSLRVQGNAVREGRKGGAQLATVHRSCTVTSCHAPQASLPSHDRAVTTSRLDPVNERQRGAHSSGCRSSHIQSSRRRW